jgi:SAM-dependent methyltransferase
MAALMRGPDLLAWLASLPSALRDAAVEKRLGIDVGPSVSPPGEHLIGYHASGVASIVRMLIEVPVSTDDVVVDLGAGLGKVVLLTRLLTGATARGIELQPALVDRAREAAVRCGVADVVFQEGDAREADLDEGTVFFLYLPFTGPVLAEVMGRLRRVASRRAIVVCSLGLDVDREAPWLVRRSLDSFWLAIYDSLHPGVPPRPARERSPTLGRAAEVVAFERPPGGPPGW